MTIKAVTFNSTRIEAGVDVKSWEESVISVGSDKKADFLFGIDEYGRIIHEVSKSGPIHIEYSHE